MKDESLLTYLAILTLLAGHLSFPVILAGIAWALIADYRQKGGPS
jgi:hypothetical protein